MPHLEFDLVSERNYPISKKNNVNFVLDVYAWSKSMFNAGEIRSMPYHNDGTKDISRLSSVHVIDPELQLLSQKVMKETWDNKEDDFWNTY